MEGGTTQKVICISIRRTLCGARASPDHQQTTYNGRSSTTDPDGQPIQEAELFCEAQPLPIHSGRGRKVGSHTVTWVQSVGRLMPGPM